MTLENYNVRLFHNNMLDYDAFYRNFHNNILTSYNDNYTFDDTSL